jgi:NADH:ubiquinone oxidoreductase subunit C
MTVPEAPAERLAAHVGEGAAVSDAYGLATVDVPPAAWVSALTYARDELGCTYFDWLSAVDELADGFRIVTHLVNLTRHQKLLVRTLVPRERPSLATATGVFAGASWHERETFEMFGVDFDGHPNLVPLLLPDGFEGNPLRKEFVLAARAAKAWPGAKEPGESAGEAPRRRKIAAPGVPDPDAWGPRPTGTPPGQAAPARPERAARAPRKAPAPEAPAPEAPAPQAPAPEEGT